TDRLHVDTVGVAMAEGGLAASGPQGDPRALLQALRGGFDRVSQEAQRHGPDEAASELTTVYFSEFEPLERYLLIRSSQAVRPLEVQFNALRGDLSAGLKGPELASRLGRLYSDVEGLVDRLEA